MNESARIVDDVSIHIGCAVRGDSNINSFIDESYLRKTSQTQNEKQYGEQKFSHRVLLQKVTATFVWRVSVAIFPVSMLPTVIESECECGAIV